VTISSVSSSWLRRNNAIGNCSGYPASAQDVGNRKNDRLGDRHVDPRHQREMIGHVAFVALAEIFLNILRPLIGFRQQHLALGIGVELGRAAS